MTGLHISINWKRDSYNSILVIVDWLTKMVHYKLVKITIDAPSLAKVIINMIVWHYDLPNSIVTNRGSLFILKFWSLLCYFLAIKQCLSTAFHSQTDSQTKRQNSTMEAYPKAFINFEQNNWARFLPMVEFVYNNAKNASTGHTPFKLNYGYYFWVFYKKNIDPRSKFKSADELLPKLQGLIIVCCKNFYHT